MQPTEVKRGDEQKAKKDRRSVGSWQGPAR